MTIKTFRGLLPTGEQHRIYLSGGDSSTGYRIVKFEVIAETPGSTGYEHVLKIYKTSQAVIDGTIDFGNDSLLGAAYLEGNNSSNYTDSLVIVFDREVVNQDIFITQKDSGSEPCNYYIELEEVKLSDAEAANVNFVAALVHT